jgi:hypothetical protein
MRAAKNNMQHLGCNKENVGHITKWFFDSQWSDIYAIVIKTRMYKTVSQRHVGLCTLTPKANTGPPER